MSPNPQQFSKYPNNFKAWRLHLSGNEWTVLGIIHEKITDWNKESDAISMSQIQAECFLSFSSIRRALAIMELPDGPLVVIGRTSRDIPIYRIQLCTHPESGHVTMFNLTPTTDVNTCRDNNTCIEEQESNLASSGLVKKPSQSSSSPYEQEEDGLVLNSIPEDIATVSLVGSPTSQLLLLSFVNPDMKKKWKLTTRQVEAILADSNGMSITTILAILEKSRENIEKAKNSIGYIRGIIKNLAPRSKANKQAEPTRKTSPRTRAPLPFAEQAVAKPVESDPGVDEMPW